MLDWCSLDAGGEVQGIEVLIFRVDCFNCFCKLCLSFICFPDSGDGFLPSENILMLIDASLSLLDLLCWLLILYSDMFWLFSEVKSGFLALSMLTRWRFKLSSAFSFSTEDIWSLLARLFVKFGFLCDFFWVFLFLLMLLFNVCICELFGSVDKLC